MTEFEDGGFCYSSFTDSEIARLMFRNLYQMFDRGGISAGRSKESATLEVYLDFTELPDLSSGLEPWDEGLVNEARIRIARGVQRQFPIMRSPSEIELLTTQEFAMIAICELAKLGERKFVEEEWSRTWFEMTSLGSQLLGLPEHYPTFDIQEFLQHAGWRKFDLYAQFDSD